MEAAQSSSGKYIVLSLVLTREDTNPASGCNLRCVFCQNHDIAHQRNGMDLTPEELGDWYIKLQEVGNVHNINLITPEQ